MEPQEILEQIYAQPFAFIREVNEYLCTMPITIPRGRLIECAREGLAILLIDPFFHKLPNEYGIMVGVNIFCGINKNFFDGLEIKLYQKNYYQVLLLDESVLRDGYARFDFPKGRNYYIRFGLDASF